MKKSAAPKEVEPEEREVRGTEPEDVRGAEAITKDRKPSNFSKAMVGMAQRKLNSKKVKEARGPSPDVPPLGHYDGGKESNPIQKCEKCGHPYQRHGEDVVKMAEGQRLSIGRGIGTGLLKKPAANPLPQTPKTPAEVEGSLGRHEEAHPSGSVGLSTSKFLKPQHSEGSGLEALRPISIRHELNERLGSKKPVKEARVDRPFGGKPSAVKSKKGVEK